MKNSQSIEIVGIGDVKVFPLKTKRQEFKPINQEGEELKSKRIGEPSHLVYEDSTGKTYEKDEVFYQVGNNKIQKIKKTEKVSTFKVVDREEVFDFLAEDYAILDYSDTTLSNFNREVGDNALKFVLKKSSVGFKMDIAYVFKFRNRLVMYSGFGTISEGLKNFSEMKQTEKKTRTIKDTIEIKADELSLIQI